MHLDITVPYRNARAHYSVLKESEGIYLAILQQYEGDKEEAPPLRIVLLKSIRNWTGSFEHPEFVKLIGKAIEEATTSQPVRKSKLT
jgi:hypothetical protein